MSKDKDEYSEFTSFLRKVADSGWRESSRLLSENIGIIDDDVFENIICDEEVWNNYMSKYAIGHWIGDQLLYGALNFHRSKSEFVLKSEGNVKLKEIIVKSGLYNDVAVLDHLAINESGEVQYIASHYCSMDALRLIVGAKSSKVRKVVFQRLGPVECLDLMLDDKIADIREEGVRMAPYGYEKLNDMTKEIARGPFSKLIGKISSEYLPMLLANRNLKDKWISRRLQERIASEEQ